jgi:hypothetical protein
MKKFLVASLLTALLSYITALFLPWWIIALVSFVVAAAIPQKPLLAFLSAAIALFLLWGMQSFIIDKNNNHILASRVADLIIHHRSSILIIFITATIGAVVSGMGGMTGSLLRRIVIDNKKNI